MQRRYPRRRKTFDPLWLAILLLVVLAARFVSTHPDQTAAFDSAGQPSNASFTLCAEAYQANCVIDGDTIRYNGERVRLEDIDAPETHDPKCDSELALGERATQRLLELLNSAPFDLAQRGDRGTDIYGRSLRTVERNGESLGGILVSEGLARPWDGARHPWCA